jgi:spore germination cell wall hydrolase CwlJ-like protein
MKHKYTSDDLLWIGAIIGALAAIVCAIAGHTAELDYGRTCLALVGYSEARSEGLSGMFAVELVVMNRLRSKRFGDSICDVALAPGQFEGIDKWPTPRYAVEPEAWADALEAADVVISGAKATSECEGALYFNTSPLRPFACQVGTHYFRRAP